MLAWTCRADGVDKSIRLTENPLPIPDENDLIVSVKASGLNRADILQTLGVYPAPPWAPPDILGLEYAGIVKEIGSKVTKWSIGDRVMGLVGGGAMAQSLKTHADEALAIPKHLGFNEAAGIPEAQLTAFDALERINLKPGQNLLIHAIGSGVGEALLDQALARGLIVWGSSRSQWKLQRANKAGLHHEVLSSEGLFLKPLKGEKMDGIIDFVGAAYLEQNIKCLAVNGSLLVLGLLGGVKASIDLGRLLKIRGRLLSATMRSRPQKERIELLDRFSSQPADRLNRCLRVPNIDSVFKYTNLEAGLSKMRANENYGKMVLDWTKPL